MESFLEQDFSGTNSVNYNQQLLSAIMCIHTVPVFYCGLEHTVCCEYWLLAGFWSNRTFLTILIKEKIRIFH